MHLLQMSLLLAAHAAGESSAGQRLLLAAHAARKSVAVQPAAAADDDAFVHKTNDELLLQLPLKLLPDQQAPSLLWGSPVHAVFLDSTIEPRVRQAGQVRPREAQQELSPSDGTP